MFLFNLRSQRVGHFIFPSIKKGHFDLLFLHAPIKFHLLGSHAVFHTVKIILNPDTVRYWPYFPLWFHYTCLLSLHQVLDKACNLGLLYQLSSG